MSIALSLDLGAVDDAGLVGDGSDEQQEPDARPAQRRDDRHLLEME